LTSAGNFLKDEGVADLVSLSTQSDNEASDVSAVATGSFGLLLAYGSNLCRGRLGSPPPYTGKARKNKLPNIGINLKINKNIFIYYLIENYSEKKSKSTSAASLNSTNQNFCP
jgi:hypothetical protein